MSNVSNWRTNPTLRSVSMRVDAPVPWAFCPPTPQTWQCHLGEYGGIVSVPCCILLHLALFILGIGHIIAKSSTLVRWATELRPTVSSQIWDFFEQLTLGLFPNCRTLQSQKKDLSLQGWNQCSRVLLWWLVPASPFNACCVHLEGWNGVYKFLYP